MYHYLLDPSDTFVVEELEVVGDFRILISQLKD